MSIVCVNGQEDAYAWRILPFLGHKGQPWQYQMEEYFAGRADALKSYFYLGEVGDEIICNIMTVEHEGYGILGHVFTTPEHRRKGAASLIMAEQMADFRQRGGRALYLGTGYDTPPYHIYEGFGFRSVTPGSGTMEYFAGDAVLDQYFAPAATHVEDAAWRHWPLLNVLMLHPAGEAIRNVALGWYGSQSVEGPYCGLRMRQDEKHETIQTKVLVTEQNSVVGFATLIPDGRWKDSVALLDIHVHQNFHDCIAKLVESIVFPEKKVQAFIEKGAQHKRAALQSVGFTEEACLKKQIKIDGMWHDVVLISRLN